MKSPTLNFLDKIILLNETTLEFLTAPDAKSIIQGFTDAGIEILRADFGFVWLKNTSDNSRFILAYKSKNMCLVIKNLSKTR